MSDNVQLAKNIPIAYRHLLRASLRAVKYSKPARYVVLERLRSSFRRPPLPDGLDPLKLSRTLEFLEGAAKSNGPGYWVMRRLVHMWWDREHHKPSGFTHRDTYAFKKVALKRLDAIIEGLGRSMNMYV